MVKVYITHGLPGSGKSYFLKNLRAGKIVKHGYNSIHIVCDSVDTWNRCHTRLSKRKDTLSAVLEEEFKRVTNKHLKAKDCANYVLVDLLTTTNDDLIELINIIKNNLKVSFRIIINWWEEDRESCIWNDENVRDEEYVSSINSLAFEKPDVDLIFEKTGVKVQTNKNIVQRKSEAMHIAHKYSLCDETGEIKSNEWSLGGTCCDCWGKTYIIEADNTPDFIEFDNIIETLAPNITQKQYDNLRDSFVEKITWEDSDYYGGCEEKAYYFCRVEELITFMLEKGLVEQGG